MNKNGPKTDPCGTPTKDEALTVFVELIHFVGDEFYQLDFVPPNSF